MTKPLALIGYLGPNTVLTRATSLIATELAAMGEICRKQGYDVALAKTEEDARANVPHTGMDLWDGETQPETLWLHQALPNIPGGVRDVHVNSIEAVHKVLPKVKKLYRLMIDNNHSMSHKQFLSVVRSKGRRCSYIAGYREPAPSPEYAALHQAVLDRMDNGSFYEVGYESARALSSGTEFKTCGLFAEQLLLTRNLFPTEPKSLDFCYIGASRSDKQKQQARLDSLGHDLLSHENSFYGGSLFSSAVSFPKAWTMMSKSKAHLITRDAGMDMQPLHRYLQALVHSAIPIVVNEPDPVGFIHDPELQKLLRVRSYKEALNLVDSYEDLLPLLQEELEYWVGFDASRNQAL